MGCISCLIAAPVGRLVVVLFPSLAISKMDELRQAAYRGIRRRRRHPVVIGCSRIVLCSRRGVILYGTNNKIPLDR